MAERPATPVLPVAVRTPGRPVDVPAGQGGFQTPSGQDLGGSAPVPASGGVLLPPEDVAATTTSETFVAMRRIVEFKEVDMGQLVTTVGLGAALKAMSDSEKNPIADGTDNALVVGPTTGLLCPGVSRFNSFSAAYAALERAAVTVGCLLKKNGACSSQKTPMVEAELPFDVNKCLEGGKWPRLSLRVACDHRHCAAYDRVVAHSKPVVGMRRNTPNKGATTTVLSAP